MNVLALVWLLVYTRVISHKKGKIEMATWIKNDGGRAEAGYKGNANDCVVRAFAIVMELPYKVIYDDVSYFMEAHGEPRSARNGVPEHIVEKYMRNYGWKFVPAKQIGNDTNMHLNKTELPGGRIIADIKNHVCAVIDGVINDTYDWSKDGEETVYGYWVKA